MSSSSKGLMKANLKRETSIAKRIVMAKLGPNSYFGEFEILNNITLRETLAKCTSNSCEIFIIGKLVRHWQAGSESAD